MHDADLRSDHNPITEQPARYNGHAALRARQRLQLSPEELERYWTLSRDAGDADLARFATIRIIGCAYRVVVARHRLALMVRNAVTDHPITVRPIPPARK